MISSYANKLIQQYAETLKAMQKVIANGEGRERLSCIWIKRGSHIAQATDGHILAILNIESLDHELEDGDVTEGYKLMAFHSNFTAIEYRNGYAFVTSKMYDQFINAIGKPINENAEWFDFDYPDLLKILPKAKSLSQSNLNESCVDAKLLCILNNIRKTNEFTKSEKQLEVSLWGEKATSIQVASYTGMILGVIPILRGEESDDYTTFNEESYEQIVRYLQ